MKLIQKILGSFAALVMLCASIPALASSYPVGTTQFYLSGAGVTSSATSIQLTSFTTPDGRPITMSMFGSVGYGAIEPGTVAKLEDISFTGVTQNANGTATLTGVSRGMDFVTPYTPTPALGKSHAGGATFIVTNTAGYLGNEFAFVNQPSTITDYWNFPTPLSSTNPATKGYVDSIVSGGAINADRLAVAGTAGETVAAGQLLYLNTSDARWYKASTNISGSVADAVSGIAEGSGTAGNTIANGVLLLGLDQNQSGLTPGANYFATNVAGTIGLATTSKPVGKARSATTLYFDPYFIDGPTLAGNNTFTGNNTFAATGTTTIAATSSLQIGSFSAWQIGKQFFISTTTGTSTFNVPSGITKIWVEILGPGGGGGTGSGGEGGGGAGSRAMKMIDVTGTSTIQYYIGVAGTPGGAAPDSSKFGTNGFYMTAGGGKNVNNAVSGAQGGVAVGGDINQTGAPGMAGSNPSSGTITGGSGGSTDYGGGGWGLQGNNSGNSGDGIGAGGSGSANSTGGTGGNGTNGGLIIRW